MPYKFNPFTGSLDTAGSGGIAEAPADGNLYDRKSGQWVQPEASDVTDFPTNFADHTFITTNDDPSKVIMTYGSIGSRAYYEDTTLIGLYLGNSCTSIGDYAFNSCFGFTGSLTIPNSVTTIGSFTFQYCSGFTGSLTIPNSVTSIGSYAFQGCSGFTGSLTIGSGVTVISNGAFQNCGFTGAYLNQPLSFIGAYAFFVTGLTTIHLRPSPNTPAGWTIGAGQTIGGKSGVTVVADWTTYPNPP